MDAAIVGAGISGGLLVGFSLFLLALDPRGAATRAFAILLAARGLAGFLSALSEGEHRFLAANAAVYLLIVLAVMAVALVRLLAVHPRPHGPLGGRAALPAMAAFVVGVAAWALLRPTDLMRDDGGRIVLSTVGATAQYAVYGIMAFGALLVLRRANAEPEPEVRLSLALVATAFTLDTLFAVGFTFGGQGVEARHEVALFVAIVLLALLACATFAWHALRPRSPLSRASRVALALGALAAALGAFVGAAILDGAANVALRNLGRLPMALVMAYALVRHRIFGIDLKIKLTIRQSTVAAAFVGVFFVVSELAQQIFQESVGPYIGIAAAGGLVFAIAPLQRVAERVADRAMPHVQDAAAASPSAKREVYRSAYVLAAADGVLTEDEERHLAKLAGVLQLSHEEVFELRRGEPTPSA